MRKTSRRFARTRTGPSKSKRAPLTPQQIETARAAVLAQIANRDLRVRLVELYEAIHRTLRSLYAVRGPPRELPDHGDELPADYTPSEVEYRDLVIGLIMEQQRVGLEIAALVPFNSNPETWGIKGAETVRVPSRRCARDGEGEADAVRRILIAEGASDYQIAALEQPDVASSDLADSRERQQAKRARLALERELKRSLESTRGELKRQQEAAATSTSRFNLRDKKNRPLGVGLQEDEVARIEAELAKLLKPRARRSG